MLKQSEQDARRAVEQANQCENETWQWWTFTAESGKLVLCGSQPVFQVKGYLVFYNPRHVCIPHYMDKALIGYDSSAAQHQAAWQEASNLDGLHCITFETAQSVYLIVCERVRFVPQAD